MNSIASNLINFQLVYTMVPFLPDSSPPDALDTLSVEKSMRRALGLSSDRSSRNSTAQHERPQAGPPGRSPADKPRPRFVQDSAVPVTLVNRHRTDHTDGPPASRATIEISLRAERAARGRAERALQDALATVRDLQTKLGHAELAHREALGAAQAARAAVDALRAEHQERELRWTQDLAVERAARIAAEAALTEAAGAHGPAARTRRPSLPVEPAAKAQDAVPTPTAKAVVRRARKVATEPRQREPQPVKWWLKSARKRWP